MGHHYLILLVALGLSLGGAVYIRLRWRRAPVAMRAMSFIAICYFIAGSLFTVWVAHLGGAVSPPAPQQNAAEHPGPLPSPASAEVPSNQPLIGERCGSDRWSVKTLSDLDAGRVNLAPIRTTVSALLGIPRPSGAIFSNDHRVAPVELNTYTVRALAVKFKGEEDHDTHVIIVDPDDLTKSMVTEFVDWTCACAISSRAHDQFKEAYADLQAIFGDDLISDSPKVTVNGHDFVVADLLGYRTRIIDPTTSKVVAGPETGPLPPELVRYATVEISGVGFWDNEHGVEGAAPNSIELHPVLSIRRPGS